jgi:hypothetical protein
MQKKEIRPFKTVAIALGIAGAIWFIIIVATGLAARSWLFVSGPVGMLALALIFGILHMRGVDRR